MARAREAAPAGAEASGDAAAACPGPAAVDNN